LAFGHDRSKLSRLTARVKTVNHIVNWQFISRITKHNPSCCT